jgi:hypothetical protein
MNIRTTVVSLGLIGAVLVALACAPIVTPIPDTVGPIAVLPPCDATGSPLSPPEFKARYDAPSESLASLLVSRAADELARRGLRVVDPGLVAVATRGRVPSSPETAAAIARSAKLDATPLFLRVRRWEWPYSTMHTTEIRVALDAMLVDPLTDQVVWEVHRQAKPVNLHGRLIAGQADAVAAEEVMKDVFASIGRPRH